MKIERCGPRQQGHTWLTLVKEKNAFLKIQMKFPWTEGYVAVLQICTKRTKKENNTSPTSFGLIIWDIGYHSGPVGKAG
jgi:hypothetical protein